MRIFVSAGDPSGDAHAAALVRAIRCRLPAVQIEALGGPLLREEADEFHGDLVALGGFGFTAAARLAVRLIGIKRRIAGDIWKVRRPDRLVLVDYYGFHIHLARAAHAAGIPVYYYVSPQVWASRPGRIRELSRVVRGMLVLFSFEQDLYRAAGVPALWVGHPLLDLVPEPVADDRPCSGRRVRIGLFPGSRAGTVIRHLPVMEEAARIIAGRVPADVVVFHAPGRRGDTSPLGAYPSAEDAGYAGRAGLDLALTVSGTVSVELALQGIPMVVMYRLSALNYALARLVATVRSISMVNILAGREIVPEFIQGAARPADIAAACLRLVMDGDARSAQVAALRDFRALLGSPGAADRAAAAIIEESIPTCTAAF